MRRSTDTVREAALGNIAQVVLDHPNGIEVEYHRRPLNKTHQILEGQARFRVEVHGANEFKVERSLKSDKDEIESVFLGVINDELKLGDVLYDMSTSFYVYRHPTLPIYTLELQFSVVDEKAIDEHD